MSSAVYFGAAESLVSNKSRIGEALIPRCWRLERDVALGDASLSRCCGAAGRLEPIGMADEGAYIHRAEDECEGDGIFDEASMTHLDPQFMKCS